MGLKSYIQARLARKKPPAPRTPFEEVRARFEAVMAAKLHDSPLDVGFEKRVDSLLEQMLTAIEEVRVAANDYPNHPIRGDVWVDGASYSAMAHSLMLRLRSLGLLQAEAHASELWARATLAVMSHYRHEVGPAMLANADCCERLGNVQRAALIYGAIIADFRLLTDDDGDAAESVSEEDAVALTSLASALKSRLRLEPAHPEASEWSDLLARATALLARVPGSVETPKGGTAP